MTKVDIQEYQTNRNILKSMYNQLKKDIEQYILRDPEAAGMIQFVK